MRVYGVALERVTIFTYLGLIIHENDDDGPCIRGHTRKARERRGRISNILKKENALPKVMARFYLTIVQSVLLYGSDSWVISDTLWRLLNMFRLICTRHMKERHIRKINDESWEHPPSLEALESCGLFDLKTFHRREVIYICLQ